MEGLFVNTFVRRVYLLAKIKEDEEIVKQRAQIEKLKDIFSKYTCEGCDFPLLYDDQLLCDRCDEFACATWPEHHPDFDYSFYKRVHCCHVKMCANCWDYCCYCGRNRVCTDCAEKTDGMCLDCIHRLR